MINIKQTPDIRKDNSTIPKKKIPKMGFLFKFFHKFHICRKALKLLLHTLRIRCCFQKIILFENRNFGILEITNQSQKF